MNVRAALPSVLVLLLASAAWGQQVGGTGENRPELITEPYAYVSDQGRFKVTWPGGCGELVRRDRIENPEADLPLQIQVFNVYCDRDRQHGVGSSVTVLWNLQGEDGGLPGPEQVVPRMENQLKTLGVVIAKQRPIRRDLADGTRIEGLEILATEPEGPGEAWMRGLVHGGDVYILAAWNINGGLFTAPEYVDFFNSFEPLVE
ncbi:MAG: hypothetical protein IH621_00705 [Krumholzibacteria bacterium]|nr:hypothetical protein [Candidatus Krumholzibacteria bacterium]